MQSKSGSTFAGRRCPRFLDELVVDADGRGLNADSGPGSEDEPSGDPGLLPAALVCRSWRRASSARTVTPPSRSSASLPPYTQQSGG